MATGALLNLDILLEGENMSLHSSDGEEERFLVSPVKDATSSQHARSSSFKNRPRPKLSLDIALAQRPRTNSLPTNQLFLSLPNPDWMAPVEPANEGGLCRVRSFKTTSKGIVNRGDSFKRSSHSLASNGSVTSIDKYQGQQQEPDQGHGQGHRHSAAALTVSSSSNHNATLCEITVTDASSSSPSRPRVKVRAGRKPSKEDSEEESAASEKGKVVVVRTPTPSHFRVLMMGSPGSGKSSLTRQFMTSEYKGTYDPHTPELEQDRQSVSVLLDGEESLIEFIDEEFHPDVEREDIPIDAYVIVFSVTDPGSYNYAVNGLRKLRVESGVDRAVILVGNKIDLARQRRVTSHDARKLASKYDCRFMETSAALNHHVDELLVGILSQIRAKLNSPEPNHLSTAQTSRERSRSKSPGRAMSFFHKLFGHGSKGKDKAPGTLFVK